MTGIRQQRVRCSSWSLMSLGIVPLSVCLQGFLNHLTSPLTGHRKVYTGILQQPVLPPNIPVFSFKLFLVRIFRGEIIAESHLQRLAEQVLVKPAQLDGWQVSLAGTSSLGRLLESGLLRCISFTSRDLCTTISNPRYSGQPGSMVSWYFSSSTCGTQETLL